MHSSIGILRRFGVAVGLTVAGSGALGCTDDSEASDSANDTAPGTTATTAPSGSTATGTSATTTSATTAAVAASASGGPATSSSSNGSGNTSAASSSGGMTSGPNTSSASTTAAPSTTGTGGATASSTTANGSATDGAGGSGTGGSVFPPGVTKPRIMIVGDSISAGPGCYKKYLVQNLTENGIDNYEFVGEYDDDCGGGVKHSAVSCTTTSQYTEPTFTVPNCFAGDTFPGMSTLVQSHNPDLILLQLGVNDVWSGSAPIEPILDNYATLIEQARAHNPNIVVVVAQIHKIISDDCQNAASTTNAEALVMAVPGWAATVTTAASPVLVADLWTNSDAHEADDCVHPNDAGAQRMGLNWYDALADILR